jgi:diguanylate cyclase (GGDEF)-like protein
MDIFNKILDGSLMPHGHCLEWRPDLLFLYVGGDIATSLAYLIIPFALIRLVTLRKDLHFNWLFLMFAGFIFFCGLTHILSIVNIWHGYYYIQGVTKAITGLISILTAIVLWRLMPVAVAIPSRADLSEKITALQDAEQALAEANRVLESKVAERTKELQKQATTDALTGILNRGEIIRILTVEMERSIRHNLTLSIIMLDLDYFKSINDNYGHQAGDTVLIDTANILHESNRKTDYLGRIGGEEFLIILPNTDADSAKLLAERYRKKVDEHYTKIADKTIHCTCSIGVAELAKDDELSHFLSKADVALYAAKDNGRNCVV